MFWFQIPPAKLQRSFDCRILNDSGNQEGVRPSKWQSNISFLGHIICVEKSIVGEVEKAIFSTLGRPECNVASVIWFGQGMQLF